VCMASGAQTTLGTESKTHSVHCGLSDTNVQTVRNVEVKDGHGSVVAVLPQKKVSSTLINMFG
jgi:hypothetical protein